MTVYSDYPLELHKTRPPGGRSVSGLLVMPENKVYLDVTGGTTLYVRAVRDSCVVTVLFGSGVHYD